MHSFCLAYLRWIDALSVPTALIFVALIFLDPYTPGISLTHCTQLLHSIHLLHWVHSLYSLHSLHSLYCLNSIYKLHSLHSLHWLQSINFFHWPLFAHFIYVHTTLIALTALILIATLISFIALITLIALFHWLRLFETFIHYTYCTPTLLHSFLPNTFALNALSLLKCCTRTNALNVISLHLWKIRLESWIDPETCLTSGILNWCNDYIWKTSNCSFLTSKIRSLMKHAWLVRLERSKRKKFHATSVLENFSVVYRGCVTTVLILAFNSRRKSRWTIHIWHYWSF